MYTSEHAQNTPILKKIIQIEMLNKNVHFLIYTEMNTELITEIF